MPNSKGSRLLAELKEIEKYCGKAAESKIISYFKKQIERIEGTCKYSSDQRMDISFNRSGINQWSFIHLGRSYYRLTKAEEDKSWKLVIEQEGYEGSIYTGYEYLTSSSEGAHIEFISYDTCKYMEFFQ